jgi:hypothetical protein
MALYCDDYVILDTQSILFATTLDPDDPEVEQPYLIMLLLWAAVEHLAAINYPSRGLRDTAFEQIVALVRHEHAERGH